MITYTEHQHIMVAIYSAILFLCPSQFFASLHLLLRPLRCCCCCCCFKHNISTVINKHLHGHSAPDRKIAFCFKSFGAFIFIMAFCDFLHLLQIINLERFLMTSSSFANERALTLIGRIEFFLLFIFHSIRSVFV